MSKKVIIDEEEKYIMNLLMSKKIIVKWKLTFDFNMNKLLMTFYIILSICQFET